MIVGGNLDNAKFYCLNYFDTVFIPVTFNNFGEKNKTHNFKLSLIKLVWQPLKGVEQQIEIAKTNNFVSSSLAASVMYIRFKEEK